MGQSSWNPRFLELLEKAPHPSDRQRSSWNFYSPAYAAEDLENLAVLLIEETGLVQELNIDRDALASHSSQAHGRRRQRALSQLVSRHGRFPSNNRHGQYGNSGGTSAEHQTLCCHLSCTPP